MGIQIRRYEITESEWERLREYFPERQGGERGRPRKDSRQMRGGIVWIARSGAAWRDCLNDTGHGKPPIRGSSNGNHQDCWRESFGIWEKILICKMLAWIALSSRHTKQALVPREGANDDSQKAQDDQCIGISRGGRSTKIHAIVDALGNPIHVQLSAGNVHDSTVAEEIRQKKLIPAEALNELLMREVRK